MTASSPPFLFDLDGTLADTLADIAASGNHVRASFGLPPLDLAAVRSAVGDGARLLLQRLLAELEPDGALLDLALQRYGEHHEAQCTMLVTAYPGVANHLERYNREGHRLAVVTNKPGRFARAILRHLGLDPFFGAIVGGDALPVRKPDPAPLRLALQQLDAPPAPGTMVGDSVQDLRAGKAACLGTIACLYGYREPALLRREGADAFWVAFGEPEPVSPAPIRGP